MAAADPHYKGEVNVRHMIEVLTEDFGYEHLKQPMTIAHGGSAKDAGLNGQLIRAEKLEKIAGK